MNPDRKTNEVIWRPTREGIQGSNVGRLMRRCAIEDYHDLIRASSSNIEWFWREALQDLGVEWYKPYSCLLDASEGFPWCRWFIGGRLNIVHNCIDRHAASQPDKICLLWESEAGEALSFSYAELSAGICRAASALNALGIRPGDSVGIYMPMVPELVIAFFAALKIGAVVVPVFSAFGPDALALRLRDASIKVLFTADGTRRRGEIHEIKPVADLAVRDVPSLIRTIVLRRTGAAVSLEKGRDMWWEDLMRGQPESFPTRDLASEHPSLIMYTSGTTGRPKGAIHTHGGVLAQVAKELAYYFDVKSNDRFFWLTDIGWMMGPWAIIGSMFQGASCLIFEGAPNWPRPDRLWEMVSRHRLTHLGISPTATRVLLRSGEECAEKHDKSTLRILGSTGEPWDPESYSWLFRTIGGRRCPVINISGGTEIMGCMVACSPAAALKPCSFQGPGLGMDVDVVDENGQGVRGSLGYLVLKKPAPSITKGFLNDRKRYLETYFSKWPGIWYHGDWARIDDDGFWFIEGRADDTIKVAGKRTGPAEIEAALLRHAAVSEAAAIGVPDAVKGEAIVCFVVIKPGEEATETLESELCETVVRSLGKTLRPRRVHIVNVLPKTRSAKIVRGAIRRRYLGLPPGDLSSVESLEALEAIPRSI